MRDDCDSVSRKTVTSGIFTPASGISCTSQKAISFGKVTMLELACTHSALWTQDTQYNIGTLSSNFEVAANDVGAGGQLSNSGTALIAYGNQVYVRPLTSGDTAAGASFFVRFTYIVK